MSECDIRAVILHFCYKWCQTLDWKIINCCNWYYNIFCVHLILLIVNPDQSYNRFRKIWLKIWNFLPAPDVSLEHLLNLIEYTHRDENDENNGPINSTSAPLSRLPQSWPIWKKLKTKPWRLTDLDLTGWFSTVSWKQVLVHSDSWDTNCHCTLPFSTSLQTKTKSSGKLDRECWARDRNTSALAFANSRQRQ